MGNTTIAVTEEQSKKLKEIQTEGETYKDAIDKLLSVYSNNNEEFNYDHENMPTIEISRELATQLEQANLTNDILELGANNQPNQETTEKNEEAILYHLTEIEEQLDTILSGIKEATNAAQSADNQLSQMR